MAGEVRLEDLVSDDDTSSSETEPDDGGAFGENLLEVVKYLDQRGHLGPLLYGPGNAPGNAPREVTSDGGGDAQALPSGGGGGDMDMNAIVSGLKTLGDVEGYDMTLRELIQLIEGNPEQARQLIQQHVGGGQ